MEAVIRTSAVSNARWIAISQVVSIGVQLVSLVWLSRLLTPADYGLVAMALVVTNFANLVRDMGTGLALIQKEDLNEETILTSFWFTVGLGAVLGILVAGLAPLMVLAFKAPGVTGILLVLAVTFPVLGSTTVHQALLERASRFPLLARIQAVAAVSGLGVGVIAAYQGAGAYSLALNSLTYALVSSTQLWMASPVTPRWFWSRHEFRGIRRFSDYLVGFNIINYFSLNADSMIIGRFLGAESLGLYSLAFRIIDFPLHNLTFVASRALYPVMSRQQAVPEEMATLYLRALSVIAFITAPMMAGLFVLRDLFIVVVLGDRWIAMGDVLAWLVPVGFMTSLTCTTGSVLMARGRTEVLFYLGILGAVLHVSSFIIGMRWGVSGVAAGYFFATIITIFPDFYFVSRVLGQGFSRFFRSILIPISLTGVMVLVVLGCRTALPIGDLPRMAQLLLLVLAGAGSYAALAFVFARQSLRDVFRFLGWK
ncbi:MAG: MOP flippase family protein [Burkholderiales bacterium]